MNRFDRWPTRTTLALRGAAFMFMLSVLACSNSPTEPVTGTLTGKWVGTLPTFCVTDWSVVTLELNQSGNVLTGDVITGSGFRFSARGSMTDGMGDLNVTGPEAPDCDSILHLTIEHVEYDGGGHATAFSGQARWPCCGSLAVPYRFPRGTGA